MIEVRQTAVFQDWLRGLRDVVARKRIGQRIARVELGLFGNMHSVGGGVSELVEDFGPGYRIYFTRRGLTVVILLCGGDKGSQSRDIDQAQAMVAELE